MRDQPIGVFDSGLGGLSVARSIRQRLPYENLLYYADTQHAPYGAKSTAFLLSRGRFICDFFMRQQAKMIVVACNTATVSVLSQLRDEYNAPFVGVEPGVKPASQVTQTGRIAVLATEYTAKSQQLQELVMRHAGQHTVYLQGCPGFVEQVETLSSDSPEAEALVRRYVLPLLAKQVDTLVLGCTHYPFLLPVIRRVAGKSVRIIQTQDAVAEQVARCLQASKQLRDGGQGTLVFHTSRVDSRQAGFVRKYF